MKKPAARGMGGFLATCLALTPSFSLARLLPGTSGFLFAGYFASAIVCGALAGSIGAAVALGRASGFTGSLVAGVRGLPRALAIFLLQSLAAGIGLALFVVPGLVFAIRLSPAIVVGLAGELGPVRAVRETWRRGTRTFLQLAVIGIPYFVAPPLFAYVVERMTHLEGLASGLPSLAAAILGTALAIDWASGRWARLLVSEDSRERDEQA